MKNPNPNSFFFTPATPDEMEKIINTLTLNKLWGTYDISAKIIKMGKSVFAKNLCYIFNSRLENWIFLSKLKYTFIISIYKKGSKLRVVN